MLTIFSPPFAQYPVCYFSTLEHGKNQNSHLLHKSFQIFLFHINPYVSIFYGILLFWKLWYVSLLNPFEVPPYSSTLQSPTGMLARHVEHASSQCAPFVMTKGRGAVMKQWHSKQQWKLQDLPNDFISKLTWNIKIHFFIDRKQTGSCQRGGWLQG